MKIAIATGEGVAEIQGLYGPFSFSEKLLQQIWSRLDFDQARAVANDGRAVRILHLGRWNHMGGPDFKDARLQVGTQTISGDIEMHLHARDWALHGHAKDPAYSRVVLHVVLFPEDGKPTVGCDGKEIPVLTLLPLLNHDLEEYAADEAIERLADHPLAQARFELTRLSPDELEVLLLDCAQKRWAQKVHYAKQRISRLGWTEACHHTAMEILGYRFNRAPMLAVAGAWPLVTWNDVDTAGIERVFAEFEGRWSRQPVRPANQPRLRLRQYAAWVRERPDWPDGLAELAAVLPRFTCQEALGSAAARRRFRMAETKERICEAIFGGAVGGTRLNTLVCDGLLPLLAAKCNDQSLIGLWYVWLPGDAPAKMGRLLRELGVVNKQRPLSHGIMQGLLGWLVAADQLRQPEAASAGGRA